MDRRANLREWSKCERDHIELTTEEIDRQSNGAQRIWRNVRSHSPAAEKAELPSGHWVVSELATESPWHMLAQVFEVQDACFLCVCVAPCGVFTARLMMFVCSHFQEGLGRPFKRKRLLHGWTCSGPHVVPSEDIRSTPDTGSPGHRSVSRVPSSA